MIVIRNNIIPLQGYKCINLFGVLFVRNGATLDVYDENHENVHTVQVIELFALAMVVMLIVCHLTGISFAWCLLSPLAFYAWYGVEYIVIRLFHRKQGDAYHDVSLEEEAHLNDRNLNYINERRHFAWLRFVKVRSWKK